MGEIMLSKEEKAHYSRHLILPEIGVEGQEKLKQARVLVIGAGGIGSPVLQYLAAAGVGKIGIVDNDTVSISNLQRQVLFDYSSVGKPKAICAAERLQGLNPHIEIVSIVERFGAENALQLLKDYDLLVDGCDNFSTRYLANDAAVLANKPLVSGSIFKFEGQVAVYNYQGGPTYRCLFPEPPMEGEMPSCGEIGVLGVLPGMIGTMVANEVIKIVLEKEGVLSGKLLMLDAISMRVNTMAFKRVEAQAEVTELKEMDWSCELENTVEEVTWEDFQSMNKEAVFLLDVRNENEYESWNISGHLIPLNELEDRLFELPADRQLVVHCEMGGRSKKAVELLKSYGFNTSVSLTVPPDQKG